MVNSNGWTDKKERIICGLRDQADILTWKHDRSAKYFRSWDKRIGIPGFVLAFIAGNAAFITAQSTVGFLGYIIASITLLGGLFSALQNYLGLSDNKQKHKAYAGKYMEFYHYTLLVLAQSRNERPQATKYVQEMQQFFQELVNKAPEIPSKISDEYVDLKEKGYFVDNPPNMEDKVEPDTNLDAFRKLGSRAATMRDLRKSTRIDSLTPHAGSLAKTPSETSSGTPGGKNVTINLDIVNGGDSDSDSDGEDFVIELEDDVLDLVDDSDDEVEEGETF